MRHPTGGPEHLRMVVPPNDLPDGSSMAVFRSTRSGQPLDRVNLAVIDLA